MSIHFWCVVSKQEVIIISMGCDTLGCATTQRQNEFIAMHVAHRIIGERATIRGVQIRAGAVHIYMYGGSYVIIVAHAAHT